MEKSSNLQTNGLDAPASGPLNAHPFQLIHDSDTSPVSDNESPTSSTHNDIINCDLKDQPVPMDVTFESKLFMLDATAAASPMLWKIRSKQLPLHNSQADDGNHEHLLSTLTASLNTQLQSKAKMLHSLGSQLKGVELILEDIESLSDQFIAARVPPVEEDVLVAAGGRAEPHAVAVSNDNNGGPAGANASCSFTEAAPEPASVNGTMSTVSSMIIDSTQLAVSPASSAAYHDDSHSVAAAAGSTTAISLLHNDQQQYEISPRLSASKGVAHDYDHERILTDLHARLARAEAARDDLSRQQGHYKGMIAKLEGAVSSAERRLKIQNEELSDLKIINDGLRQQLQDAHTDSTATPERCRTSVKTLQEEAKRISTSAQDKDRLFRELTDLIEYEACEAGDLLEFHKAELAALSMCYQECEARLAAFQQEAGLVKELYMERDACQADIQWLKVDAYHTKERMVDLQAELSHTHALLLQAQKAAGKACEEKAVLNEKAAHLEKDLLLAKELGVRLFKQMKGILHVLSEKQSTGKLSGLPEIAVLIKSVQEWMASHNAAAAVWYATATDELNV
ncbi:hypothetical protein CEUSTIGMA_g12632.t1 [Chlamydomonas eustigma]|uniref:Uncharacterized protein n=1 Tax=Chlamydomonas eustigma TaxID=1157962 RepID=A0A250XQJ9_9CHLO|nr:hypothetical protein CEUSTIGMA_g12632.t1 [Chlamydomonas eustigma]|eukprot:GAX85212.1 hypothetical protein CEUSTIGMA_g12632.t1 [Chlamydomonas eustigma]